MARLTTSGTLGRSVLTIGVVGLCLGLIAAVAVAVLGRSDENTITVDFDRTVSLYEGSKVRILGVDVGLVEKITPRGQTVRATITWDADYDVPADAVALIVSPSVVGDRFVQLAPAYTGGAKLEDGAHLDQSRTGTPTELDETFEALNTVAVTLGPEGLNEDGSLSEMLANSAKNLDGKGAEIRESIAALAELSQTAEGTKDEFFSSLEQIETFVSALEANDASVRRFNSSLAAVSDVLADESDDLQSALRELAAALSEVQGYVAENRTALRKNIDGLNDVTKTLARQRKEIASILELGPKALSNLAKTYNPTTGAIDGRASIKGSRDGRFTTLTDSTFVRAACGPAVAQDSSYQSACDAMGEIIAFLAENAQAAGGYGAAARGAAVPAAGADARTSLEYLLGVA